MPLSRVLLTIVCLAFLAGPGLARERHALIVALTQSDALADLPGLRHDAKFLDASLEALGFKSGGQSSPDRGALSGALRSVQAFADDGDLIIFYYAGHGASFEGEHYLLGMDARAPLTAETIAEDGIALSAIIAKTADLPGSYLIVIDTPRTDPAGGTPTPLAITNAKTGESKVAVLFSTSSGGTTWYGADRGGADAVSPFAAALARELAAGGTLGEMVARLAGEVNAAAASAGYEQLPELVAVGGAEVELGN